MEDIALQSAREWTARHAQPKRSLKAFMMINSPVSTFGGLNRF
jgi:hypothetical protein